MELNDFFSLTDGHKVLNPQIIDVSKKIVVIIGCPN